MSTKETPSNRSTLDEWLEHWESGTMAGFQVDKPHPKLVEHYDKYINGKSRAKIFVPLCGDTYDMKVLVEKGHQVIGVECSARGIESFFNKHSIEYTQKPCDKVKGKCFQSRDENYKIYCCDIFNFDESVDGQFDAIIDFGAMGALQKTDIPGYVQVMKKVMKPECRHILELFLHDTQKYPDGRPLCFSLEQLQTMYGDACTVEKIDEGPNPYEGCEGGEEESHAFSENSEEFPPLDGAAYFLIKPKQN